MTRREALHIALRSMRRAEGEMRTELGLLHSPSPAKVRSLSKRMSQITEAMYVLANELAECED